MQHPDVSAIELPVLLGDKPQRVTPIAWLLRESLDTLIQLPISRIEHQVNQLILIDRENNRVSVPVTDRTKSLIAVATALAEARIEPQDIALRQPTLDEVFIHLTTEANK
jgi:hypothetical protein